MNPETLRWVLAAHALVTFFMTGLIWFVQVVHYPLFDRVGKADFASYEQQNTRRTTWVVAGPMLLELGLSAVLAWSPGGTLAWCGLALLGIIWLSTAVCQVPMHCRLEQGFDRAAYRSLVRGNWVRTIAWSLRGVLAVVMLASY
jgi:hypothetical protein